MKHRNNYFTIVKTSRTGIDEHLEMQGLFINLSQAKKGFRTAYLDFVFECDNRNTDPEHFWTCNYIYDTKVEIEHGKTESPVITTFEIFKLESARFHYLEI